MRAKPIPIPLAILLPALSLAAPTTQPATQPAPVTITIHDIDDSTGPGAVNLETLQPLTLPRDLAQWDDRRLRWLKDNGADIVFDHETTAFYILGWGTTLAPVNNSLWSEDLAWIDLTLADPPGQSADWLHLQFRDTAALPMTFAYRTWHGTTGLLRISDLQPSPWRLKVELRPAAPAASPR